MSLDLKQLAGITAGALSLVAFIPYIRSILAGATKPERASWIKWTSAHWIFLLAYWEVGGGWATALSLGMALGITVVFLLSLRYGVGGWTILDRIGFGGSFVAIALWMVTNNPETALFCLMAIDFAGLVETVVKTWKLPGSEDPWMWTIDTVANTVNLFAIEAWDRAHATYPLYLWLSMGAMMVIAFRKPK